MMLLLLKVNKQVVLQMLSLYNKHLLLLLLHNLHKLLHQYKQLLLMHLLQLQ